MSVTTKVKTVSLPTDILIYCETWVKHHLQCHVRCDIMEKQNSRKAEEGETKTSSPSWGHIFRGNDDAAGFQNRSSRGGKGDGSSLERKGQE